MIGKSGLGKTVSCVHDVYWSEWMDNREGGFLGIDDSRAWIKYMVYCVLWFNIILKGEGYIYIKHFGSGHLGSLDIWISLCFIFLILSAALSPPLLSPSIFPTSNLAPSSAFPFPLILLVIHIHVIHIEPGDFPQIWSGFKIAELTKHSSACYY